MDLETENYNNSALNALFIKTFLIFNGDLAKCRQLGVFT